MRVAGVQIRRGRGSAGVAVLPLSQRSAPQSCGTGPQCGDRHGEDATARARKHVSTFTPTSIRFDPPGTPDYLGSGVLKAFARPQPAFVSWGFLKTLILGLITCGIAPILLLPKRLRWYTAGQLANLEYARQWIEERLGSGTKVEPT